MSPFSWSFGGSSRWNGIGRFCDDPMNKSINGVNGAKAASHCSTVERLYAWEKKLYLEVKVKLNFNILYCCPNSITIFFSNELFDYDL